MQQEIFFWYDDYMPHYRNFLPANRIFKSLNLSRTRQGPIVLTRRSGWKEAKWWWTSWR